VGWLTLSPQREVLSLKRALVRKSWWEMTFDDGQSVIVNSEWHTLDDAGELKDESEVNKRTRVKGESETI